MTEAQKARKRQTSQSLNPPPIIKRARSATDLVESCKPPTLASPGRLQPVPSHPTKVPSGARVDHLRPIERGDAIKCSEAFSATRPKENTEGPSVQPTLDLGVDPHSAKELEVDDSYEPLSVDNLSDMLQSLQVSKTQHSSNYTNKAPRFRPSRLPKEGDKISCGVEDKDSVTSLGPAAQQVSDKGADSGNSHHTHPPLE